jgi:hypothetical protein
VRENSNKPGKPNLTLPKIADWVCDNLLADILRKEQEESAAAQRAAVWKGLQTWLGKARGQEGAGGKENTDPAEQNVPAEQNEVKVPDLPSTTKKKRGRPKGSLKTTAVTLRRRLSFPGKLGRTPKQPTLELQVSKRRKPGARISVSTIIIWLKKLGFTYHRSLQPFSLLTSVFRYKKGLYYDGHERDDVVKSRQRYLQVP